MFVKKDLNSLFALRLVMGGVPNITKFNAFMRRAGGACQAHIYLGLETFEHALSAIRDDRASLIVGIDAFNTLWDAIEESARRAVSYSNHHGVPSAAAKQGFRVQSKEVADLVSKIRHPATESVGVLRSHIGELKRLFIWPGDQELLNVVRPNIEKRYPV